MLSGRALRILAQLRFEEAHSLLRERHYAGAYYLGGYCVELGLKACIARQFVSDEVPDWAVKGEFRTHDLKRLISFAGLDPRAEGIELHRNWGIVVVWSVDSRYEHDLRHEEAEELLAALGDSRNGVFEWIKTRW